MRLSFDNQSFLIDGKRDFLVSGEFHYFRVPAADWRRRMELFKKAGGNCLATYVPWGIHEPEEGKILFGDRPERDLAAFLRTAAEAGLMVIVRPGPYQYSELVYDGLPAWLVENTPELRAKRADGTDIRTASVSYLHPLFLEKARRYYRAFAEVVRPFLASKGGPVVVTQLDNELYGVHVWFGSIDFNPTTLGLGDENGRYASWLRRKYGTVERLNEAYGTGYPSFGAVRPRPWGAATTTDGEDRHSHDDLLSYLDFGGEYLRLLLSWLREDGIDGPICHNAANPEMNTYFEKQIGDLGDDFLIGSDHYYTLNQNWGQDNPTPLYALRAHFSLDSLRSMGMPPTVLEMPGGSPTDIPPILPNDLLATYMTNLALGMKGLNYYVFTGGPNFGNTNPIIDIYDYNAPVHADGTLNDTYPALVAFGDFLRAHRYLMTSERVDSVQIGFEMDWMRSRGYSPDPARLSGNAAMDFSTRGLLYTLRGSRYSGAYVDLVKELDISRPLLIPAPCMMSETAQRNVVDFLEQGGRLLIAPAVPLLDLDLNPCTILADAIGRYTVRERKGASNVLVIRGKRRPSYSSPVAFETLPDGAEVLATDPEFGDDLAFEKDVGPGRVIVFGLHWMASYHTQSEMLEELLDGLGALPCAASSNRNVFTTLYRDEDGGSTLFAINLHASPQATEVTVYRDGHPLPPRPIALGAMEARAVRFPPAPDD